MAYRAAKDTPQADIRSAASVSNALKMLPWRGIKLMQIKQNNTVKNTASHIGSKPTSATACGGKLTQIAWRVIILFGKKLIGINI